MLSVRLPRIYLLQVALKQLSELVPVLLQGYYVRKNMLGADGDFITSPEISQVFGEVFSQLQSVVGGASVSVHLVEVSPALSWLQAETLTGKRNMEASSEDDPVYRHGETAARVSVSWYRRLEDVPAGRQPQEAGSGQD
ncbi:hypothetical protein XENOCAPTIV_003405 [Xenoophorus captivus]|uniref:Protein arginine methyltransferase NDUFAF7 n=1 Tax=Xenoophorus captivus TaxID=1517983 RepID=A0ABV0SG83_9TELE